MMTKYIEDIEDIEDILVYLVYYVLVFGYQSSKLIIHECIYNYLY
jgi:hypothetical protein